MIQSVLLGVHLTAFLHLITLTRCALRSRRRFFAALLRRSRFPHPVAPLLLFR
jgi:hypothetical protein